MFRTWTVTMPICVLPASVVIDCCAGNATPGSVSATFDASEVRLLRQSAYRSFVPRPAAQQRARNGHTLRRVLTIGSGTTVHATPLTPCAQRHETRAGGPRSGGTTGRRSHDTLGPRVALGAQESIVRGGERANLPINCLTRETAISQFVSGQFRLFF